MKKLGLTLHSFYRFPATYFALWLGCSQMWRITSTRGFPALLAAGITLFFTLLLLYSISRVMILHEKKEDLYEGDKTWKQKIVFLWKRPKTKLALLLFLLLPLPYPVFRFLFTPFSPFVRYLLSRLFLPLLLIAFLFGSTSGLSWHELNEKKKAGKKKINRAPILFLFHAYKYIPIYILGAYALLSLSAFIFSLPGMVKLFLTTSLGVALLAIIGALWIIRIQRGVAKRRKFLTQLSDACASQNLPMPEIKGAVKGLFRKKEASPTFEITVHGRKYVCRLISSLKPFTMYRFYPSGEIGHVHTVFMRFYMRHTPFGTGVLFRQRTEIYEKKYNCAFEAEEGATKIFIFNPCSKIVEGQYGNDSLPLDNGMKIGDYTFYTASGFTGAIRRDCLHRKANE